MFSQYPHASLQVEATDGMVVVKLNGKRLDESNVDVIGEQLFCLVDELKPSTLQLDLRCVQFLSSVWLGKIIALFHRVQSGGGHLSVTNVHEPVYELFQVTHLTKLLDVRPLAVA